MVFAVPADYPALVAPDLRPQVNRLLGAARAVGSTGLVAEGAAQPPAIPAASSPAGTAARLAVPVLLAAASSRPSPLPVVIDFASVGPGAGFQRTVSSSVRRGERLYLAPAFDAPEGDRGGWLEPARFFKGKIVFLDDLVRQDRPSPLGSVPRMEALAHATATLLSGPADPAIQSARRGRADAAGWHPGWTSIVPGGIRSLPGWRLGAAIFLVVAFAASEFLGAASGSIRCFRSSPRWARSCWRPSSPSSSHEPNGDRNRAAMLSRFLAPQVVQELLDEPARPPGLGGGLQRVCVLFVDARDFTGFSERHPPEQVIETIQRLLEGCHPRPGRPGRHPATNTPGTA